MPGQLGETVGDCGRVGAGGRTGAGGKVGDAGSIPGGFALGGKPVAGFWVAPLALVP